MRLSQALDAIMIAKTQPGEPKPQALRTEALSPWFSLPQAKTILYQYRWSSLGIFGVILSLVVLAAFLIPSTYQSETKLFVRVGRESVSLDPTATTGQMISVSESRESEINSVVDVLQSRVIFEQIVEKLGRELASPDKAKVKDGRFSALENDAMVRELTRTIAVTHSKKSNVITITAKAKSPELAQKIVQEMLVAFREQHLRINRTEGSFEFFQTQKNHLEQQLDEARSKLRDAKNRHGLVTVEGKSKNLEEQIKTIELALMENQKVLAGVNAESRALESIKRLIPAEIVTQKVTGFFNDAEEQTRQQLNHLEMEYEHLLKKFTPRQSNVRALKQRIQTAQAIVEMNKTRNSTQTTLVNPAFQQIDLKQMMVQSRKHSLEAEGQSLREQREKLKKSLEQINNSDVQFMSLEREVALYEKGAKEYSEKLEQARIDQELEGERISNVNIVQPATFLPKPVSPKRRVIVALGVFVAAIAGCGYGFAKEFLNNQEQHLNQFSEENAVCLN